jgi:hypothetical protein
VKLRKFVTFNAILFIGLGIAFALYGPLMIDMYGFLKTDSSGVSYWYMTSFARILGVALFGYGFTLWAINNVPDNEATPPETRRRIVFAQLLANLVGFFVAITQQIQIWWNLTGWITVGIFLVLAIGYLYYLISNIRA